MSFTTREIAQIKRTAQNVAPIIAKRDRLIEKMTVLQNEIELQNRQIDAWETGVKAITGGYTSADLVDRVVTVSTTSEGKEIKTTTYVLKYPDTILPPVETEITEECKDTLVLDECYIDPRLPIVDEPQTSEAEMNTFNPFEA